MLSEKINAARLIHHPVHRHCEGNPECGRHDIYRARMLDTCKGQTWHLGVQGQNLPTGLDRSDIPASKVTQIAHVAHEPVFQPHRTVCRTFCLQTLHLLARIFAVVSEKRCSLAENLRFQHQSGPTKPLCEVWQSCRNFFMGFLASFPMTTGPAIAVMKGICLLGTPRRTMVFSFCSKVCQDYYKHSALPKLLNAEFAGPQ